MYFAEFNAVLAQARDSVGRILKFDGKVTGIVVNAEMLARRASPDRSAAIFSKKVTVSGVVSR